MCINDVNIRVLNRVAPIVMVTFVDFERSCGSDLGPVNMAVLLHFYWFLIVLPRKFGGFLCTLTFRNLASYIQDGRKITL